MTQRTKYRIGIDVGTNSVGFAAVEIDDSGMPTKLLNNLVQLHDSGVDPEHAKAAETRLKVSGVARRTRRLIQRRRKRLRRLDARIRDHGWPIVEHDESADPYLPWNVRAQLAQEKLEGEEQKRALSIAVRHMARHRGWRSPYSRIESLFFEQRPSDQLVKLRELVTEQSGVVFDEDATPAEIVVDLGLNPGNRLRSAASTKYGPDSVRDGVNVAGQEKIGVFGGKLMQSDNANEIIKIGRVQGLSENLVRDLIRWIFEAESPIGKAGERAGRDQLPGQNDKPRAAKPHPEFQRFRIVSVVANLRLKDSDGSSRPLTLNEKMAIVELLMTNDGEDGVTWNDVAKILDVPRDALMGTASLGADGERVSAFPPSNTTNIRIIQSKIKPLVAWWEQASMAEQAALVVALSNADNLDDAEDGAEAAKEFLSNLDEVTLEKIDAISLPAGRAAYSVDSLRRLSERMIADSVDLHEARKLEFGVPDDWAPPSDPIGAPVGNPAVDRVLKIVNRWMIAAVREWGPPVSINIENVRGGFTSEASVRKYEMELKSRNEQNRKVVKDAHDYLGISGHMRSSDITRFLAIRRQNSQCAYCGTAITYSSAEMDHIVPRKGEGSTNTRDNLVAVCEVCNKSKSNTPFAVWAASSSRPGVSIDEAIERVKFWIDDDGLTKKQNRNFKYDVISRMKRTSADEPIDNRSIESVAWMANELKARVEAHFKSSGTDVQVRVYRGSITSEARKASGLEGKIQMIGGHGKTRLDRRHHAVDATVIALMSNYVAETLAERDSRRRAQQLENRGDTSWREYRGRDSARQVEFGKWLNYMNRLLELLNLALINDQIPVMQNLRLRLGNGSAHDATIRKFDRKLVGSEWTREQIDLASTPQMWTALSRDSEFDEKQGLPENPNRELRVKNQWFGAHDELEILPKKIAAIPVRGGYAEVGGTIHHGRLYRIPGPKKDTYGMVRVFGPDLLKYQNEDLFSVELGPETISMRDAKPGTREAILAGKAEYLGWIVTGDELCIDLDAPPFKKHAIGQFMEEFPGVSSWTIRGLTTATKLTLKPTLISAEGLRNLEVGDATVKIVEKTGWVVEVGVLFQSPSLKIIRRDSLGCPRLVSNARLPVSLELM